MALVGLAQMKGRIRRFAQRYPFLIGEALVTELEVERAESDRKIPVDTGAAKSTSEVVGPVIVDGMVSASIVYGADPSIKNPKTGTPVADYIIPLHENLDAYHPNGEAKFLESTLKESERHLGPRVARRAQVDKIKL